MSRPTDAKVKAWINRNDEYKSRSKKLHELKMDWRVLKYLNHAFLMKYELIRTKSANERKEDANLGAAPDDITRYPRPKKKKRRK